MQGNVYVIQHEQQQVSVACVCVYGECTPSHLERETTKARSRSGQVSQDEDLPSDGIRTEVEDR